MIKIDKKIWMPAISIVIIVLLVAFTLLFSDTRTSGEDVVKVDTQEATKGELTATVTVTGVLVPRDSVNIQSKIAGKISEIKANVGDRVKAGDVLIELEKSDIEAQYDKAKAYLKSIQDSEVQAKIQLDIAQKNYERAKSLLDEGAMSQSQFEDVKLKYDMAKAQYDSLTGSGLDQAAASLKSIELQLEATEIKSPISGIVATKNINPGEMVSPGISLMMVVNQDTLKLQTTVPQDVVPYLKTGQKVSVTVDAIPDRIFEGTITSIGPVATVSGQYFPIEISIENKDGILKGGMTAKAEFTITKAEALLIPESAVIYEGGKAWVYVVENNRAKKREVVLGIKGDGKISVLDGLKPGEKVITSNVSALQDGMTVNTK